MASRAIALYAASKWTAVALIQDAYATVSLSMSPATAFAKWNSILPQIAANIALVKNWTIHGIFWGAHQQAQPRVFRRTLEESVQWLSEGKVRVPVSHK
jgi:phage-related minor tail protein